MLLPKYFFLTGVDLSSPRAKNGGIWGGEAKRGYFRDNTRLAGPWPRRHRAVAIEGIDAKNTGESSSRDRWGDQSNKDDDISYAKMLKFILPTLGIWLASPIMGLIDAGVIGERLGGEYREHFGFFGGMEHPELVYFRLSLLLYILGQSLWVITV